MDAQENTQANKSSWWWYVLLGLIVFIVIILIVDKKNRTSTLGDRQNQVIEHLRSQYADSKQASPEDQAKVMAEIKKSSSPSKVTPEQQNQIIEQIRAGNN